MLVVCLCVVHGPGRKGNGVQGLGRPGRSWLTFHPRRQGQGANGSLNSSWMEGSVSGEKAGGQVAGRGSLMREDGWMDRTHGSGQIGGRGRSQLGALSPEGMSLAAVINLTSRQQYSAPTSLT